MPSLSSPNPFQEIIQGLHFNISKIITTRIHVNVIPTLPLVTAFRRSAFIIQGQITCGI
jgi:hypothetical protein